MEHSASYNFGINTTYMNNTSIVLAEESLQQLHTLLALRATAVGAHCGSEDGDDGEE